MPSRGSPAPRDAQLHTGSARVICDVFTPNGDPFPGDPRGVLKRQLERAKEMGYVLNTGPELEFFLLKRDNGVVEPLPHDAAGYFDLSEDLGTEVRKEMVNALEDFGIRVETAHHEVATGQHEIDFQYADALRTADNAVTFKTTLKAIAATKGLYATFMPKPFFGINGSGMHTHQSLWDIKKGKNAFSDPKDPYGLSETARQYIAGTLEHARGMIAVLAPLVNSYKRLVPGYEAPVYVGWARINRSALIRIPQSSKGQYNSVRIELRCPDPSSNPYLAFAVMLAAGLDGIERKLTPPDPSRRTSTTSTPPSSSRARSGSCRARCARPSTSCPATRSSARRSASTSSSASSRPRPRSGTSTGCRSRHGRSIGTSRRSSVTPPEAAPLTTTSRPRLLLLSMYPLDRGRWGPTARITQLRDELSRLARLDVVDGARGPRRGRLMRYALSGRLRGLHGIYVENSSTLPSETDLAFLALARLLGIPVLTYVRDAQYLFGEYYRVGGLKGRLARALFLPVVRLLRAVSTRTGYPSAGLARAVRDASAEPLLLPPGSPAPHDIPRRPEARSLLFVGGMRFPVHGLDLLVGAVERVRAEGHDVDVVCVSIPGEEPPEPRPAWMRVEHGGVDEIRDLLPGVLATVQPRRRSPYNDLAVPIKVMEYLAYGRPLLVTDCTEQARIVREADAGIVVADTVESMTDGLRRLAAAPDAELDRWAARATDAALASSWEHRARQIVDIILKGT